MSIKVSIVEDDKRTRESLALLIGGASDFSCVGAHATAETALKKIPQEQPDVILLDLELPAMSGIEFIRELKRRPAVEILVLTIHDEPRRIYAALEAGASGYLVKPMPPRKMIEAIKEIHGGGSPMSAPIARLVVQTFQERGRSHRKLEKLTPREQEILELLAKGYSDKEISQALGISEHTVNGHIKSIYVKLQAHSRAQAVAEYLRR